MNHLSYSMHSQPGSCKKPILFTSLLVSLLLSACAANDQKNSAIHIERQGGFAVGGRILGEPLSASQHCDHGVVEYQIPQDARSTNLLMWHSASALAWKNRWDGEEGFQSIFLRRGFPVYIWDGPQVGRANWGCTEATYRPAPGVDQQNFSAWRLGPAYQQWFAGVQFPTDDPQAWNQATRARYQEFDTLENIALQAASGAELAEQIGPSVALTNSAGGLRALLAAIQSDEIRGIVAYENVGYVFPEGAGPGGPPSPFGPIEVPMEDFMKLTHIPIQIVWGDNLDKTDRFNMSLEHSRLFVDLINQHGGDAELLMLTEQGLHGNTHLPFADLNNLAVADLLSDFLSKHQLD